MTNYIGKLLTFETYLGTIVPVIPQKKCSTIVQQATRGQLSTHRYSREIFQKFGKKLSHVHPYIRSEHFGHVCPRKNSTRLRTSPKFQLRDHNMSRRSYVLRYDTGMTNNKVS
jgi:dTDP-4-dehydrorhamnose reductase